jgi:MFS family permease
MLGFSLGPLIGGAFTHYIDWRAIFWASCVAMLVATGGLIAAGAAGGATTGHRADRFDWAGFLLLAVFMTSLVSALHALPAVLQAPLGFLGFGILAAAACVALLWTERRSRAPLIDLGLFAEGEFVRAVALASIAMSSVLALLLFYNLDAQSPTGLGLTPVGAGLSLLPLSVGLLIFAFSAPLLSHRFGPRRALALGNLLIALAGVALAFVSATHLWIPLLAALFVIGLGLALPYATAPRLALSALPPASAGAGSGIINACTFLGGSIGVAAGAVAFALGGLPAVTVLIAIAAVAGMWLCRGLPATTAQ